MERPVCLDLFLSQLASYFYVSAGPHDAAAMEHWRAIEAQKALDYNLEELLLRNPPKDYLRYPGHPYATVVTCRRICHFDVRVCDQSWSPRKLTG